MSTDSIAISFRVTLPGGSFQWTNDVPKGWTGSGYGVEPPGLPWLFCDAEPDVAASPERDRIVDRSSSRLYRDFLRLAKHSRGTQEDFGTAVVGFANRYGFLGETYALHRSISASRSARVVHAPQVESLEFWKRQVQIFYELNDLAELLRTKDVDGLRKRITWDSENQEVRYIHQGDYWWARTPIATKARHPDRYARLQATQAFDRAWTYLTIELNKRLTKPLLVLLPSDPRGLAVAHPRTLLDALYLRLYLKAANIDWTRVCGWCGNDLPEDCTARREFCDATCRYRRHMYERSLEQARATPGASA